MPLAPPVIDDRRFATLVDETLARARVHTPEWTNFNQSDPGVTLVQLFSFLTESLLYRANLTPERQRIKFLQLLRVPLAGATAAQGLVSIVNDRGLPTTQTVQGGLEVRAGAVPFLTQFAIDVLPIESRVYIRRRRAASDEVLDYYRLLYASYQTQFPDDVELYETVALDPKVVDSVDLSQDAVDRSLWIALLARPREPVDEIRRQIGGRTLMVGIVPALDAVAARLVPGGVAQAGKLLRFELPNVAVDGRVERDAADRPAPRYREIEPRTEVDLLTQPGVVQLALPGADDLRVWSDVDPLERGVGEMPPSLDDADLAARLITWIRVSAAGAARARITWAGINTVPVRQIERIVSEPLADGDGRPDQTRRLARAPVLAGSVRVVTRLANEQPRQWTETDDLAAAPAEVPIADPRLSSSATPDAAIEASADVFEVDAEAGVLRFGDGLRGRRVPAGARVFASYEFCQGAAGNVADGAINAAPQLPSGFSVANPVQTWGGADPETVATGEKQIKRYLQHRDRLVSADDFESIASRTPGVQIGRIEVLPAYHPDLGAGEPGSAPGAVTLMAIPAFDAEQPDAPRANRLFLNALCQYLEPRRLVTTELVIRGADYKGIWISVGVDVATHFSIAEVVENVKARLRALLAPIGPDGREPRPTPLFTSRSSDPARGWPLRTAVSSRVLMAEAARVEGVLSVADVVLAEGSRGAADTVEMAGLELPRILGLSVVAGDPVSLEALRGDRVAADQTAATAARLLPVPVVPETC